MPTYAYMFYSDLFLPLLPAAYNFYDLAYAIASVNPIYQKDIRVTYSAPTNIIPSKHKENDIMINNEEENHKMILLGSINVLKYKLLINKQTKLEANGTLKIFYRYLESTTGRKCLIKPRGVLRN